jgi:hypothetical protein
MHKWRKYINLARPKVIVVFVTTTHKNVHYVALSGIITTFLHIKFYIYIYMKTFPCTQFQCHI